ncbi:NUDIX domain-containing protein [Nocardia arthritidis]|uniref:NUDIX domain-containing protein n=1 Tax=Nocardia arthritidis TaxID=228602 RepID=A0A6G9YDL2_9NOCA|nr:NUDIX domain-containing protein [Nocardia arthritidis]
MNGPGSHDFETVASRTVYSGAILALRLDKVAMPGGKVVEREVVEHHGAVAVLAVDDADNVVLIRQYRHPVGARLLELPAGLLDVPGEDPLTAARRELAEETGLAARDWSVLVDVALSPGFTDEALRVYLASGLSETDRPEPEFEEADLELVRLPVAEAVRAALAGRSPTPPPSRVCSRWPPRGRAVSRRAPPMRRGRDSPPRSWNAKPRNSSRKPDGAPHGARARDRRLSRPSRRRARRGAQYARRLPARSGPLPEFPYRARYSGAGRGDRG